MTSTSLLPPNATPQERALEGATARLADVPIPVRDAWNPDTCPAALLPWLAWAFSVDEWQNDWTEAEKRGVIKAALYVHKHKGTLAALRRAVEPLGYIIRIIEWFNDTPQAEPFTFRLEVGVLDKGVDASIYDKLARIIETYKNVRSHMRQLTIKAEVRGTAYFAAGIMSGVDTTIYPYVAEDLDSIGGLFMAAAEQTADTVAIYPA
ncbi:baseplate wedge protein [Achromobacter phage Mano]|uniref:Baseplate wedge protein n=1 Tax=Achromobacter phage Mano TaxID=2767570 RepID=A0A7L8G6A6_9CAUD|nr:tail protein [Achromobacter phage Mano]QOE32746.1 baseplate wedge protein [Achromobacter phage Mano]